MQSIRYVIYVILCLFTYSGVQSILWCVFVLLVFALCLVYPMFLASQDCPFFIAPSVFSNVYMLRYDTYDLNKMRPL
jgi:hypothetical protein